MGYIYIGEAAAFTPTDYEPEKYTISYNPNRGDYSTTLEKLITYSLGTYIDGIHVFGLLAKDGYAFKKPSTLYRCGYITGSTAAPTRWDSGQSSESIELNEQYFKFIAFYVNFTSTSVAIDWAKVKPNVVVTQTATFTFTITGTVRGAKCNIASGSEYQSGTQITIKITADSGKWFTLSQYVFKKYDGTGSVSEIEPFQISADRYTLTWTGLVTGNIDLDGEYVAVSYSKSNIGVYTHIFTLSDDSLNALSNICFKEVTSGEYPSLQVTESSNNQYVMKLYKMPFTVPQDLLESGNDIYLGAINTTVSDTEITSYHMQISGGTVTVPYKYNNVFDYLTADCRLYVPYIGFISMDIKYVIGKSIDITYLYNLLTGNCTVVLQSDGYTVDAVNKNICYDLPFYQSAYSKVEDSFNATMLDTNTVAFMEVTRNVPFPNTGIFGKRKNFYSKLKDLIGFQVVSYISITEPLPYEQEQEIRQILSGGVFI